MKKKKLSLTLLGIILWCSIAFSGAYLFIKMFPNFQKLSKDYSREELLSETTWKQEVSGKISALKKKYALRGLIIDGESYLSNEQYGLALKNFSEALEDHPNNTFLLEKVWDTYFAMKKFEAAYNTYIKIPDPGETLKRNIFFSSLHAKWYKIHNHIDSLSLLINSLNFDTEESTYYKEIIKCSKDFHACKKSLESYIEKNKDSLKSEWFIDYKNTLTNYENFRLEDLYYKNTLLLGSMFKQKLYPLVISIGLNLNKEKPDYKPVLQMIAQSFYEIGEYKSAKAFLDMYLKYEPNDADGWYLMGVINMKLQEYILSNIQFNKAYELGFKEKLVVKRQIIFNLSILEQTERMLSELASIINNFDNYQKIDLYLAIYYHIIYDKTETALLIANKW
jgi:tetratricopeptide (TPR) repeat protein